MKVNRSLATVPGIVAVMVLAACTGDPTATPASPPRHTVAPTATATSSLTVTDTSAPQPTPRATPTATSKPIATPTATTASTATPVPTPGLLPAEPHMITLTPSKDNTLYRSSVGNLSNGAGQYFFVGNTGSSVPRRGVIAFDLADVIPAGATITDVTLTLNMSRSTGSTHSIELHTLTADWGEGASDASSQEGVGVTSTAGDATWIHRTFNTTLWQTHGGDFSQVVSARTPIGGSGPYTWGSTDAMVTDVQGWLDNTFDNFGWLLLGNEDVSRTAKRFDSKENSTAGNRPMLTITYDQPAKS